MVHEQPSLPYPKNALTPYISEETLEYHYGKHHKAYVDKLNSLIPGTEFEDLALEEIIKKASPGPIFNNAGQVWNHTFYWNCMTPNSSKEPGGKLADAINKTFGSFKDFQAKFSDAGANNFGSGWTWLVKDTDGSLKIVNTSNAGTPMTSGQKALLTVDVWEHAYYIDYRNARPKYLEEFWNITNWDFVAQQFT